eukprot:TRINITY_DN23469_c0_g1_i1.p1 TRINITY_DN23469_c0_g1~~TRINITY_DN23469_c0_g1_i1.p1  ORF type:complete len:584 (-),score=86.44 TRINITY_DN23469_c0_g1_i1:249-2000(-)
MLPSHRKPRWAWTWPGCAIGLTLIWPSILLRLQLLAAPRSFAQLRRTAVHEDRDTLGMAGSSPGKRNDPQQQIVNEIMNHGRRKDWPRAMHSFDKCNDLTSTVFTAMLQAALLAGAYEDGIEIYSCVPGAARSPPLYAAAIRLHSKLGKFDCVEDIWEEVESENLLSIDDKTAELLISARLDSAAQQADVSAVFRFIDELRSRHISVQLPALGSGMEACKNMRHPEAARLLLSMMSNMTIVPDVTIYTAAMASYRGRGCALHELDSLCSEMEMKGVTANANFVEAKVNAILPPVAETTDFEELRQVVFELSQERRAALANIVHGSMGEGLRHTRFVKYVATALDQLHVRQGRGGTDTLLSSMFDGAAGRQATQQSQWQNELSELMELLHCGPRQSHAKNCSDVIQACGKSGQWQAALSVLAMMSSFRVAPDSFTYRVAISACGKRWQESLGLFNGMQELVMDVTVRAYNAAISACAKDAQWQHVLSLLAAMQNSELLPDVITYSAATSASEKGGHWQTALDLVARMHHAEVVGNAIVYRNAILACKKGGQLQQVPGLASLMKSTRVDMDIANYLDAIDSNDER